MFPERIAHFLLMKLASHGGKKENYWRKCLPTYSPIEEGKICVFFQPEMTTSRQETSQTFAIAIAFELSLLDSI